MKAYEVQASTYDAARPYIVVTNLRSFNRVVGHYETREQAVRRARRLNQSWNYHKREQQQ